jgi:hypothetical protein
MIRGLAKTIHTPKGGWVVNKCEMVSTLICILWWWEWVMWVVEKDVSIFASPLNPITKLSKLENLENWLARQREEREEREKREERERRG